MRRNALAGVVVGIVAIPLSIALAVAVGAAPVAGLYTAIFAGAAAALTGSSRYNVTGPAASLVPVVSAAAIAHGPSAIPMLGILSAVALLFFSLLRVGRLVRYMPGLVIVGFSVGITVSIALGQLNNLLAVTGTDPTLERMHQRLWDTLLHLDTVRLATPLVTLASLGILVLSPRIVPRIPPPLIAVVVMTAVVWAFGIDTPTIASRYADFPRGVPTPGLDFFDASLIVPLIPAAIAVAAIGSIETLLCAVVADDLGSPPVRHNPDRELRSQSIANVVGPIMGGIPATAVIARTVAGVKAGGDSRLTPFFHSLSILVAMLVLGGLAGLMPLAVLGAVLVVVAWNIAQVPRVITLVRRAPREDLLVLVSTALITVFVDLAYAVAAGILVSAFLLIRRLTATVPAAELSPDPSGHIRAVSPALSEVIQAAPGIACYNLHGVLSFHTAAALERELLTAADRPLILRMKDVSHVDTSGLLKLTDIIEARKARGARTALTAVPPSLRRSLQRFGLTALIGVENVFEHTRDAIVALDPAGNRASWADEVAIPRPDGLPQRPPAADTMT
ncbi:MAG: SulP family inorganic anion transporter [Tepidiformaceae bacterium]